MLTKFKYILNEDELNNITTIKEYLQFSFRKRKPKKDYKLYINICKIYDSYPNTIIELLDNIPTLGYYKDYFYILMFSRNTKLDTYIHNIIINQLNLDLKNLKENKEISTLGKWLPREQSKINKRCNFIDKFNLLFYPYITDKFSARRKYRKLKTMLNVKLGTLEAKMCTKKYEEINFNKVPYLALKRNMDSLMKHDECKQKLDDHEISVLKKMSLSEFIKTLLSDTHQIDRLTKVWENNRFRNEIPYIDKLISNSVCIIDLSKDTFSNGSENFTIGMALLIDHFSLMENRVIVCNDDIIKLNGTILERAQKLLQYASPCKEINIEKYYDLVIKNNSKCNNIIFVTSKQINNIEFLCDKNMTMLQYTADYDSYDIVHYNGDKVRRFVKYEHKNLDNIEESDKKSISNIIQSSSELKDKSGIYFLMFLMFLLILTRIMEWL